MSENDKKPWDRMFGESAQAFAAFCVYRDMGLGRSLQKTQTEIDKRAREARVADGKEPGEKRKKAHSTVMGGWSTRFAWVSRSAAWDDEVDRVKRMAALKEVENMAGRHAQLAVMILSKAVRRLNQFTNDDEKQWGINEVLNMAREAVRIERLSRGSPDPVEGGDPTILPDDLSRAIDQATDDQLKELSRAYRKLFDAPATGGSGPSG